MKRYVAILAALILIWVQPAHAQSILRDAETEAMFKDMSRKMIIAAGLSPANVQVVLVNDDSINAFVVGGQTVYIHSGLIQAADNANQVQGVIAHGSGDVDVRGQPRERRQDLLGLGRVDHADALVAGQ